MTTRRVEIVSLVLVTALAAVLRLSALRALPVFGDEAIFLRLARIVRAAPLEQLWVSLRAPSAPLHVWVLALALPVANDPVLAGRLVSVFFGVLLVAALAGAVHLLGRAFGGDRNGPPAVAAIAASVLAALSPFLVFTDRLSRVDSLYALETVLASGLSVAIAVRERPLVPIFAFGLLMGMSMLTRQAVSYPLWLLPPIAFACRGRRVWRPLLLPLGAALVIALLLWLPMLTAEAWPSLSDRIFHLGATRPSLPAGERAALFIRNLGSALAAFWTYLTPPVLATGLAGFFLLARTRGRLFAFLAAWLGLLLVPAAMFAADYFPRYAVPAALPLLAAGGFAIAFLWTRLPGASRVALAVLILAWPAIDVVRGLHDWEAWRLLPIDRQQYVSGWSAGSASQAAASFLASRARDDEIAVIVPHVSGNPADAVWLLLEGEGRVGLYYAEDFLQKPALSVHGDVWTGAPAASIAPNRPVYFVSQDPVFLGREGWAPADRVVRPLNPGARLIARFENPPNSEGEVESAVEVFRLR